MPAQEYKSTNSIRSHSFIQLHFLLLLLWDILNKENNVLISILE